MPLLIKSGSLLSQYLDMIEQQFALVEGMVLAVPSSANCNTDPSSAAHLILSDSDRKRSQSCPEGKAMVENEQNHCHFDFPIGANVWERWQNNLCLAVALRQHWILKFAKHFPGREFVLFIYNELSFQEDLYTGDEPIEILPTLRMWSGINDPHTEMYKGFRVDEAKLDMIEIDENFRPTFIHYQQVFTKACSLRKSFVAKIRAAEECHQVT